MVDMTTLSIFKYKLFKGLFKKKLKGEYYVCFMTLEDGYLVFQFMAEVSDNTYIVHILNGGETRDSDYIDELLDKMKYDPKLEVIEMQVPVTISGESGIKIKFLKPSKVFKNSLKIYKDSRLAHNALIAEVKMKGDNKPGVSYKIGEEFGAIKGMINVTKLFFIKNIIKNDTVEIPLSVKKLK
jgi:hypothetical protein